MLPVPLFVTLPAISVVPVPFIVPAFCISAPPKTKLPALAIVPLFANVSLTITIPLFVKVPPTVKFFCSTVTVELTAVPSAVCNVPFPETFAKIVPPVTSNVPAFLTSDTKPLVGSVVLSAPAVVNVAPALISVLA